ncbi:MAG: DUF4846 domain-containing protein [Candidatus Pacebacteria bacterium]|nr:DUF4846 domain-containing protein [Candidatus Paceibacterota bacterium]
MDKKPFNSNISVLLALLFIVVLFVVSNNYFKAGNSKMMGLESNLNDMSIKLSNSASAISALIGQEPKSTGEISEEKVMPSWINKSGYDTEERFLAPDGFEREEVDKDSFAYFLRHLSLKDYGSPVLLYNGREKANKVYESVIDMDVGSKDLQQCADAVIRLRAEYLYQEKDYSHIHFNFTNGFRAEYEKWMKGYRIVVDGNKVRWEKRAEEGDSYETFREFLDTVFMYAGTLSLSKELESVKDYEDIQIGDVLVKGGNPGHAVIVFDVVVNKNTKKKAYLLGQSFMPAQEIHILKNLNSTNNSPWYLVGSGDIIKTPEWTFSREDLKRFPLDKE